MDVFLQEVHGYLLVVQDKVVGKLLYDSVAVSGLDPGAINANNNRLLDFTMQMPASAPGLRP